MAVPLHQSPGDRPGLRELFTQEDITSALCWPMQKSVSTPEEPTALHKVDSVPQDLSGGPPNVATETKSVPKQLRSPWGSFVKGFCNKELVSGFSALPGRLIPPAFSFPARTILEQYLLK